MTASAARTATAALCACLVSGAALAQGRPSSVAMTCAQTVQLVVARGALVLGTGGMTYDRYVRDQSFCETPQSTKREFVPTRDNPACSMFTCRDPAENANRND